jgi:hypothetical protein
MFSTGRAPAGSAAPGGPYRSAPQPCSCRIVCPNLRSTGSARAGSTVASDPHRTSSTTATSPSTKVPLRSSITTSGTRTPTPHSAVCAAAKASRPCAPNIPVSGSGQKFSSACHT